MTDFLKADQWADLRASLRAEPRDRCWAVMMVVMWVDRMATHWADLTVKLPAEQMVDPTAALKVASKDY